MSDVTGKKGFATRAIHHGYNPLDHQGALNPPVYMSSTFAFDSAAQGGRRFQEEEGGYIYSRISNPTLGLLEERMAILEGGEAALVTSSGMGAITSVFWTLVNPGDEIIVDRTLYGCTFTFFNHGLERFGVKIRHVDLTDPAKLAEVISDKTRIVYFETPANPNMRVVDIAAISEVAHSKGATVVVDNTYCSPYLQRPLELGADLVVHSATKYLGGHGDLMAGVVVGSAELMHDIRLIGLKDMTGAVLSAQDANLILRGLKTLNLRMDRHCKSGLAVARYLESHSLVSKVYYPGLKSFEYYDVAKKQMSDFGGMIALELKGGLDMGRNFIDACQMIVRAVSLGDAETLIQHPATMTHSTYTEEERAKYDITDSLVRLSVGLEEEEDILSDLEQALGIAGSGSNIRVMSKSA
ncbi:methionine gamma-lyase [Kiloniella antarctica]|uniref:L-methionine gamma-lyase n=1 Tax=Kiloniella antarctica TaxID=1550907 RepID=A0ABW5BI58_9PROT